MYGWKLADSAQCLPLLVPVLATEQQPSIAWDATFLGETLGLAPDSLNQSLHFNKMTNDSRHHETEMSGQGTLGV